MAKLIIFSAPSGSGKSTIINYLLTQNLNLAFSISATSRPPRGTEKDGVEYFFLTPDEFRRRIANDEFLEYEEVYQDRFYGTLKEQMEKQLLRLRTSTYTARKDLVLSMLLSTGIHLTLREPRLSHRQCTLSMTIRAKPK